MTVKSEQLIDETFNALPTIWGHEPRSLHDRYWASRGVQVVRIGTRTKTNRQAELYLLLDGAHAVLFDLRDWIEVMNWTKPDLLFLRCHANKNLGYREELTSNEDGEFLRFERRYKARETIAIRVGLTCDPELAEAWQNATNASSGWKQLRSAIPSAYREVRSARARIYRLDQKQEMEQIVDDLVGIWSSPGATISRANRTATTAWIDGLAQVDRKTRIIGPIWVGAGRRLTESDVVVGPAVLWDDPDQRPAPEELHWADIEPTELGARLQFSPRLSSVYRFSKRGFDIVFAIASLMLTLPFYPLVMLAIFIEDGWPPFFLHERETLEGRTFRCIKFRSMRKNAGQMATQLVNQNQADGPQFFIDNDPRVTRVGRILRKTHLDELPQFFNVLAGQMSVVGPRPSPRAENQYSPEWRETRLSVRPGITGLWQVRRTRLRGRDFQEWIKYDIQYVENMSWRLDLKLIWQTVVVICRRTVRQ